METSITKLPSKNYTTEKRRIRLGHGRDRELMKEQIGRFEEKRGGFPQHFVESETLTLRERVELSGLWFLCLLCFTCEPNSKETRYDIPPSHNTRRFTILLK